MPHLHGNKGECDLTVTGYVVHDERVSMHLHRKLGIWLAPGGHVELDQNPLEALYDEIEQEAGLSRDYLDLIATNSLQRRINRIRSVGVPTPFDIDVHPVPAPEAPSHRHIDMAYALRSHTDAANPAEGESQVWEWMNADRLQEVLGESMPVSLGRALIALELARGEEW